MKCVFSSQGGLDRPGKGTTWRCTYVELVAANITALDIAHKTIILPILRLANGCPSCTILNRRQGI